jgi:hypothetical protein
LCFEFKKRKKNLMLGEVPGKRELGSFAPNNANEKKPRRKIVTLEY